MARFHSWQTQHRDKVVRGVIYSILKNKSKLPPSLAVGGRQKKRSKDYILGRPRFSKAEATCVTLPCFKSNFHRLATGLPESDSD